MIQAVAEELETSAMCWPVDDLQRRTRSGGSSPTSAITSPTPAGSATGDLRDFDVDPPPDLAIEVEITNSILNKLEIYARLGVPELWRFDGEILSVWLLQADGSYAESARSAAFPFLPMDEVSRFLLDPDMSDEETRWGRSFRAWVREVLLPIYRNQAAPE